MSRDEIHCICPFGSTYQDVKFDFVEDDLDEIVHVSYFCMPVRSPSAATLLMRMPCIIPFCAVFVFFEKSFVGVYPESAEMR